MVPTADGLSSSETDHLLARARAGEGEAFCRLAEQYESRLLRQACGMTGNPDTAEDLVSETLFEAWRSIGRYDHSCRFSTWLFSILLHRYQKQVRRAKSRPISIADLRSGDAQNRERSHLDLPDTVPSPSQDLIWRETSRRLRDILNRMPEQHREVLLLRFFEDASLAEIASTLHCPMGTVKSRLHYALDELRKLNADLNPEGLERDI